MKLFFELLKVSVGNAASLSATPDAEAWREMLECAKRQALVGVCFAGIEALPEGQRPDKALLMEWYALTQQIETRNRLLNELSVKTCRYFEGNGFMACVLKGQGNAAMYPWPARRQSGDIDVWVMPKAMSTSEGDMTGGKPCRDVSIKHSRVEVLKWARTCFPDEDFDMKHIHFPIIKNVDMEVHFVPSQLRNLFANQRLIRYYEKTAQEQMSHGVKLDGVDERLGLLTCPTSGFNMVLQLTHIFNHFLSEGVGLRQVMDYYFLLLAAKEECELADGPCIKEVLTEVRRLGLMGFLQALMWVMHEVLGMKEECMVVPMDAKRGRVLLDEILAGGNFGHYESRYWYSGMSRWKFYVARIRRMAHFLRYYPDEVLWDVPFRIWQRCWMAWMRAYSSLRT